MASPRACQMLAPASKNVRNNAYLRSWAEKPILPLNLRRVNVWQAFAFVVYALAMIHIPALISLSLFSEGFFATLNVSTFSEILQSILKLMACATLLLISAQGYQLLGFVGHEGFHFNLHSNRTVSALLGIIFSSATLVFYQTGVSLDHLNHHRFVNTEQDPDLELFGQFKTTRARIFRSRLKANITFFLYTLKLALGKPIELDMSLAPFSLRTYQKMALFNFACAWAWIGIYIAIFYISGLWLVLCVVLPLIIANFYSAIRPYLEHNQTGIERHNNARSRTHWLFTLFYAGNNFHFEHHLYPSVCCFNLPKVHRLLIAKGWISPSASVYEHGFLSAYQWVQGKYMYGHIKESS